MTGIDRGEMARAESALPAEPGGPGSGKEQAALGPAAEPVSAAENPAPERLNDTPAEARGRRIISTPFVRLGPDEPLAVELRGGRTVLLRGVEMRRRDFCGVLVSGGDAGASFCGDYGDVAAAWPGNAPAPDTRDPR